MTVITVSSPAGGRAVFRARPGGDVLRSTGAPGSVELPTISADHYWQVTLRDGAGLWSENFAIAHPGPGTHQLESLDRLPGHEAGAGGFVLAERVTALETQHAQLAGEWAQGSQRIEAHEAALWIVESIVDAHQLGEITWWLAPSGTRSFPAPAFTSGQRSLSALRLVVDVVTDGLQGVTGVRVVCGSASAEVSLRSAGDSHRYPLALDFPSGDPTSVSVTVTGAASAGRLGLTVPRLVTPVERSA